MTVVRTAGDEARWHGPGGEVRIAVPQLAGAAVDDESGLVVALSRAGAGRLHLFGVDGTALRTIEAPPGYTLSYLVPGPGALRVVAAGEIPFEGWHDWHFALDAEAGAVHRAGPAY